MKSSLTMTSSVNGWNKIMGVSDRAISGFLELSVFDSAGAPETILIDRVGAQLLISFLQSYVERSGQPAGVASAENRP